MKGRQSGKRARSRRKIMNAAKMLFEEKGIGHITFNDIAVESGMCRTTIFNHFATINDLYYALVDDEVTNLVETYKESGSTGAEAIRGLFHQLFQDTGKYPVLACKLSAYAIIRDETQSPIRDIEQIIRENLPAIPEQEKGERIIMITGVYYGLVNNCFINKKEFDPERMYEAFLRLTAPYIQ
jgi:AcrR family transcriptional regulator